jgi:hypothetical protein
VVHKKK